MLLPDRQKLGTTRSLRLTFILLAGIWVLSVPLAIIFSVKEPQAVEAPLEARPDFQSGYAMGWRAAEDREAARVRLVKDMGICTYSKLVC